MDLQHVTIPETDAAEIEVENQQLISNLTNNDNRSTDQNSDRWNVFGEEVPRSQFVYICQMIIISIIIVTCIVNLSCNNGNAEMWVSFFGCAFGAMLPPPKIKKTQKKYEATRS